MTYNLSRQRGTDLRTRVQLLNNIVNDLLNLFIPSKTYRVILRRSALALIREAAPMSETEARAFLHFYLFSGFMITILQFP